MYDGFLHAIEMKDHKESQMLIRDYVRTTRVCNVDFHRRRHRRNHVSEPGGRELAARIYLDRHPNGSIVR